MGSITIGSNYTSIFGKGGPKGFMIAQCSRKFGDEPINVAPSIKKERKKEIKKEKKQLTARGAPMNSS
jgi:hypothetical protein